MKWMGGKSMVMMRGKEHRMIDPKINHLCLVNWVHMLLLILYAFVWCMKYLYSDMKMSSSEDNFIQKFYTHVAYLMTLVVWFFPTSVYKNKENSKQYPLSTLDMSQWWHLWKFKYFKIKSKAYIIITQ